MSLEMQNLRDDLTDHLHALADEQDAHARSALQAGDLQKGIAHRGAAVGLRMAAATVSENLSRDAVPHPLGWVGA
ncbi:MAG: hypothetical protein M5U12_32215 [Verrucomicrobia bacterium]|nr:hypothetical protein [Verrucomicrobiota bacterium]